MNTNPTARALLLEITPERKDKAKRVIDAYDAFNPAQVASSALDVVHIDVSDEASAALAERILACLAVHSTAEEVQQRLQQFVQHLAGLEFAPTSAVNVADGQTHSSPETLGSEWLDKVRALGRDLSTAAVTIIPNRLRRNWKKLVQLCRDFNDLLRNGVLVRVGETKIPIPPIDLGAIGFRSEGDLWLRAPFSLVLADPVVGLCRRIAYCNTGETHLALTRQERITARVYGRFFMQVRPLAVRIPEDDVTDPGLTEIQVQLDAFLPALRAALIELEVAQSDKTTLPGIERPESPTEPSGSASPPGGKHRYSLRKGCKAWILTFDGQTTAINDQIGVAYAGYLFRMPNEWTHALGLVEKVLPIDLEAPSLPPEPGSGKNKPDLVGSGGRIHERAFNLDNQSSLSHLKPKFLDLQAVIADEGASESEKEEAKLEIKKLYDLATNRFGVTRGIADKASRAVHQAFRRLYQDLIQAVDENGQPDHVACAFAAHIQDCILKPSSRSWQNPAARRRAGMAGRFVYEPPPGVSWVD